ncbi:MAG TPA: thioesterase family protein [Burkholderiales bacterium]|nr:thioesterase family protein [Burkholderiales bacterium]
MAREAFAFSQRLRVRWAEVDKQNIVFNGHYLTYFDVTVTEYWRAIGLPYPETGAGTGSELYTVKATVEYHRPAHYDDWLDVHIRCTRIGRSSLRFLLEIWRDDEHLVSGELVYVNADPATQKSAPVPGKLVDAIVGFERTAPERAA